MQEAEDDLSKRLNSITFSTSEESLTRKLETVRIAAKPVAVMFGGGNPSLMAHTTAAATHHKQQPRQQDDSAWDSSAADSTHGEDDEGWGNLPSTNTAAAGDSLFGFSSILQTDCYAAPSNSVNPNSAFAKFRDAPVSFTSALNNPRP